MTTIHPNVVETHLAQGLRERAADLGDEDRFYQRVLATIAPLPQRRWFGRWPAGFGRRFAGHPTRRFASRRGVTLLAAGALVSALVGSAAIGARFLTTAPVVPTQLPSLVPTQLPSLLPSGPPSDQPSIAPVTGRIVYTRWRTLARGEEDCTTTAFFCHRASIVISDQDGSDQRELFPEPHSLVLAASPDGSKLIVSIRGSDGDPHTYITDVDGSAPRLLDTHWQSPCLDDWGFSFSADGSRLVFSRDAGPTCDDVIVATMDMTTGEVVALESTHDYWGRPALSPDGARVAFGNHVIDVDGSHLQQIAPSDLFTDEQFGGFSPGISVPQWSSDGSLIAFTSSNDTFPTDPPERNSQRRMDIWVVRPDGTDLQRLTTDTVVPPDTNAPGDFGAAFPTWTRDGRIVFTRYPADDAGPLQLWVMNADGSNATQVDPSDPAALTAIGCVSCPYPGTTREERPDPSFAFWIRAP